jgi:hypothetical protein
LVPQQANQQQGPDMDDPEIYKKYAAECKRLAKTMSPSDRKTMLEIAEAWLECARTAGATRSSNKAALRSIVRPSSDSPDDKKKSPDEGA